MTKKTTPAERRWFSCLVPEAGIEPARLAAGDFLTTSAFAAGASVRSDVRGLEHAFTVAPRWTALP